ncbi:periplasmic binding protein-like I [Chytridium lagenaria]|nr:periplasmic binding protein-like I [Chytridium lagenaria]
MRPLALHGLCTLVILLTCRYVASQRVKIPIGILLPYQHPTFNISIRPAIETMAWIINNHPKYSIPGAEVEIRWKDSQETFRGSVTGAIELAMQDKVVGIVGEWTSGRTKPTIVALNKFQVYQCSTATDPTLSNKDVYKYHFRIIPSDEAQGRIVAQFVKRFGWKQVAIMAVNTGYGVGLSTHFLMEARKLNITILASTSYSSPQDSYASQMQSISDSGARIILFFGYDTDLLYVIRDAKSFGLGAKVCLDWNGWLESLLDVFSANSKVIPITDLDGLMYSTISGPKEGSVFSEFRSKYKAAYRSSPSAWGYFHADCLIVLVEGIKRLLSVGFTMTDILERNTNVSLVEFLRLNMTGTTGPLIFR